MGAKTWMVVYADKDARAALAAKPALDEAATEQFAQGLFAGDKLERIGYGDLSYTSPPKDEVHMGCFAGVTVVATQDVAIDYPSKLSPKFISAGGAGITTLHAMHSVVDWFAYAIWESGKLVRSLSVAPEHGVQEDIGTRLPFEEPYWSGAHPAVDADDEDDEDPYPLPFHPLELAEEALKQRFGYQLEGYVDASLLEPEAIKLIRYKRVRKSWWKFW